MSNSKTQSSIPPQVNRETISLNPNSAQGKALARIHAPLPEDEYITVGEIGTDIDMKAIQERIKQRGYKIKISCQD